MKFNYIYIFNEIAYLHYEMEIRGKSGDSVPHLKFFKQNYWKNVVFFQREKENNELSKLANTELKSVLRKL